jgi:hypothetical protein
MAANYSSAKGALMAVIQVLLDSQAGPLPLKGQFQPQGDLVPSVYLTGTAQSSAAGASINVQLSIVGPDGQDAGGTSAVVFSNEAKQHKTLLALLVNQKPWDFGQTYTWYLTEAGPGTITDANDFFSLMILY